MNYCSLTIDADTIESVDHALDRIHAQLHRYSRSVIFVDNAASPRAEPLLHALANLGRVRRLNAFRPEFENLYSGAVFVLGTLCTHAGTSANAMQTLPLAMPTLSAWWAAIKLPVRQIATPSSSRCSRTTVSCTRPPRYTAT